MGYSVKSVTTRIATSGFQYEMMVSLGILDRRASRASTWTQSPKERARGRREIGRGGGRGVRGGTVVGFGRDKQRGKETEEISKRKVHQTDIYLSQGHL